MQSADESAAEAAAVGRVREGTSRSRSLVFDYAPTRPAPCKHGAADDGKNAESRERSSLEPP